MTVGVAILYWTDMMQLNTAQYGSGHWDDVEYDVMAVFETDYSGEDILEQLFSAFNWQSSQIQDSVITLLKDFETRSMSVGDVIGLTIGDRTIYNRCEPIGWKIIDCPAQIKEIVHETN